MGRLATQMLTLTLTGGSSKVRLRGLRNTVREGGLCITSGDFSRWLTVSYAIGGGGGLSDIAVALFTIPSAFKPTLA
jgi:hypothetical protein